MKRASAKKTRAKAGTKASVQAGLASRPIDVVKLNGALQPLPAGSTKKAEAFFIPQLNITLLNDSLGNTNTTHFKAQEVIDGLNKEKRLGQSDWTLAHIDALYNLCDRTQANVIPEPLRELLVRDTYWSSVLDPSDPENLAFVAYFGYGTVDISYRPLHYARVLACRVGGPVVPGQ